MLTGEIPEFLEKNATSEDVDIFGGCSTFFNFFPKFMRKFRQNEKKTLSENRLFTLSLCEWFHPIYVLMISFSSALSSNVFICFR